MKKLILTSSPATTSKTVTNDWLNDILTMSSRLNSGILSSLTSPCSLAISVEHKKAAHTALSGVNSAIVHRKDERLKKRAETQENAKFHFQAPPMLVQKFPRQLSTLSTTCFSNQNLLFQKFCSTAVGLLSSTNNFVCKEKEIRKLP